MPELKLYTVSNLRAWLMHDFSTESAFAQMISPARAWAIIHNPVVKEDDPVLAAIMIDGEIAAFTTAFPELLNGQRYWWFSSLWCSPKYRGQGYGLIVVGSLAEVYGVEYSVDRWGAPDTVEIFTYFGHKTTFNTRYIFGYKVDKGTPKGKLVHCVRSLQKQLHNLLRKPIKKESYQLRYLSYIDDETFAFVEKYRNKDYFLHTQEHMNWQLQYPFTISAPLLERLDESSDFSPSEMRFSQMYAIQVWENRQLVGFYVMKHNEDTLHLLFAYYDPEQYVKTFASIRDHIVRLKISQFITENKELADYISSQIYFPKNSTMDISYSCPASISPSSDASFQYGDGDSFTVR